MFIFTVMKFILHIVFALPFFVFSQIPAGYYNSAQGLTGNNLKIALHDIIKNHTDITYSGLWQAFAKADQKPNGKVWDIYSYKPVGAQPYEYTFVTNQCGNYSAEGDCYNREHSWPQSWFNSETTPSSDLFHIYPTDGKVNGQRANYPYANVSNASWTSMNGSKLGSCSSPGYNGTVFEPLNEFKGDLARTYFYMTTRYYSEDSNWSFSPGTNGATILQWQLDVLMSWHQQDPVSAKEIARNDSIYKLQNNRNPFIDHPEWAIDIWSPLASVYENGAQQSNAFTLYPNPSAGNFYLISHKQQTEKIKCTVTDVTGKIIIEKEFPAGNEANIDAYTLTSGIYFVNVVSENYVSRLKFVKE